MEHEPGNVKAGADSKLNAEYVEKTSNTGSAPAFTRDLGTLNNEYVYVASEGLEKTSTTRTAPAFIRDLLPEERQRLERALVRRIDLRLMPPIIIIYIMNYLDRNNIATARIAGKVGLEQDLGLTTDQYLLSVSILFVGYILMQVPSNLFLNKIGKPAIYLPTCMIIWGAISAATAAAHNFAGLVAIRFFLGISEAAFFPGAIFFLSCWYTRKELAFRSAVLYSGALISGAFSGLIAAGITTGMDGKAGISAWRWLFIIEGAITIAIALITLFILPNFPRTTSWLTEQERELAVWRLEEDIGLDDWVSSEKQTFWHGFALALKDIKVWALATILLGIVSAGSVTNFFPSVVQTLGYSTTNTLLLTAPPYVLTVITAFLNAWHADRTGERILHITLPMVLGIAAFILAAATTSVAPRYVAMMLMLPGVYSGYVVVLAWISNIIPRPPAKRAAALAFINAISNASSIYASFMYVGGPRYIVAFAVDCCTLFMALVVAVLLRIHLGHLNKKLDRGENIEGKVVVAQEDLQAAKKGFRYLV